jgi:hypothetical protein
LLLSAAAALHGQNDAGSVISAAATDSNLPENTWRQQSMTSHLIAQI